MGVIAGLLAWPLFTASSPSVTAAPPRYDNGGDIERFGGGVRVVHERGVTVAIALRAEANSEVVDNGAYFHLYAAWPRAWNRPPLILAMLLGEAAPAPEFEPVERCTASAVFPDGRDCGGIYVGDTVRLPLATNQSEALRVFQPILAGFDPVSAEGTMYAHGLNPDPSEELLAMVDPRDVDAGDIVVGGIAIPMAPSVAVERDGSQARVILPGIDTSGVYFESLCQLVDCTRQAASISEAVEAVAPDAALDPLLVRNQPPRDDDSATSWIGNLSHAYVYVGTSADWTPFGAGPPRLADWPDLVWDAVAINALPATDSAEAPSFLAESESAASIERVYGFGAAVFSALAASLLLLALEESLRARRRRAAVTTGALAPPPASTPIRSGRVLRDSDYVTMEDVGGSRHDEGADPVELALAGDVGFAAAAAAALHATAESYRRLGEQATAGLRTAVARLVEERIRTSEAIAKIMQQLARPLPPNWPADRFEEGLRFVAATRWPIVWVPDVAVVADLLDAPEEDRASNLVTHGTEVVDSCEAVLTQVTTQRYVDLVPFVQQVIDAHRSGHIAASQALAASLLTTVIQHHLGYETLRDAADELAINPEEADFDALRAVLIFGCVPNTLSTFWPSRGDPVPVHFNRHASLHLVSAAQYTEENALVSLIMLTALVRELHELEASGRWTPGEATSGGAT